MNGPHHTTVSPNHSEISANKGDNSGGLGRTASTLSTTKSPTETEFANLALLRRPIFHHSLDVGLCLVSELSRSINLLLTSPNLFGNLRMNQRR